MRKIIYDLITTEGISLTGAAEAVTVRGHTQTEPHAPLGGRTCQFLPFYSDRLQFADNGRTTTKK